MQNDCDQSRSPMLRQRRKQARQECLQSDKVLELADRGFVLSAQATHLMTIRACQS